MPYILTTQDGRQIRIDDATEAHVASQSGPIAEVSEGYALSIGLRANGDEKGGLRADSR